MGNKISWISNVKKKKTQFQHFSSEMNKTNLPLASLCVFGLISSFWAFFVMTVTTFIRRLMKVVTVMTKKAQNDEISPKTHKDARGKLVLFISLEKC